MYAKKNEAGLTIGVKTDPVKLAWIINVSVFKYLSFFWQTNPSLFQSYLGASMFTQVN